MVFKLQATLFAVSSDITPSYTLFRGLKAAFCCFSFSARAPFKYQLIPFVKSKGC
jgi:hypothetical protein